MQEKKAEEYVLRKEFASAAIAHAELDALKLRSATVLVNEMERLQEEMTPMLPRSSTPQRLKHSNV